MGYRVHFTMVCAVGPTPISQSSVIILPPSYDADKIPCMLMECWHVYIRLRLNGSCSAHSFPLYGENYTYCFI